MNKLYTLFAFLTITVFSFAQQKQNTKETDDKSQVFNCQIVEKPFINKGGHTTDQNELYLRCSAQDYFIKLCESKVAEDELRAYVGKGIEVKGIIQEGSWDICSGDPQQMQSRTGKYVVLNTLIE